MRKRGSLGEFEVLILAAIARLGGRAYGAELFRELVERTGRDIAMGAVYTTLYRLEEKGLLTSEVGEATPVRGGRARRYFSIEPAGVQAVQSSVEALASLLEGTSLELGPT